MQRTGAALSDRLRTGCFESKGNTKMKKLTSSVSLLGATISVLCLGLMAGCTNSGVTTVPDSQRTGLNKPGDPNETSTNVSEFGDTLPPGVHAN